MKLFVVVACTLLAVASADVSHLSKKYLPPKDGHAHGDERVTTTIEKQELQELPEQIEYVDQPVYGQQEQLDHMAPVEHMMDAMMPSAEYLPPAMVRDAPQQQQEMEMEEPTTTMAADAMPSNEYLAPAPQDAPAAPLNQYLAPPPTEDQMAMMMEQQQPNYQQYQEELMRQQMMMMEMMEQQQQQMDEAVQPQAPIEPVAMEATMEPEPAHILANDGYHYKNADEARFRLRH